MHISDDGSANIVYNSMFKDNLVTFSRQDRKGVGASLNKGFKHAFKNGNIVLYAVDDWALTQNFDLTPWVKLLNEREDAGMVRLGPPHPYTQGKIEIFTKDWQGWGLRLDRISYAFGHRPALYHKRMIDHYGWFEENSSALDCELDYAARFIRDEHGPDIVLALPHPWQHDYSSDSLSEMEPNA